MWARRACSARRRRSSGGSLPSGSTSRSKRLRKASRAGLVRALRSEVRAHEISAAIRALMFLVTWHHLRLLVRDGFVSAFVSSAVYARLRADTREA
jgi:hypothetical protein